MGSVTGFTNAYIVTPGTLPAGNRQQLAGVIKAVELQFQNGAVGGAALTNVDTRRARRIVFKAQRDSPQHATLITDYFGLNAL